MGKNDLPSRGVAEYPTPPIIGNKKILNFYKNIVLGNTPGNFDVNFISAPWGMGKTHFGYKILEEIIEEGIPPASRQLVSSEFSKNAFALYVPISLIPAFNLSLTFQDIIRASLYMIHPDKKQLSRLFPNYEQIEKYSKYPYENKATYDSCQETLKKYLDHNGRISDEEDPIKIIIDICQNIGVANIVIILDEIEEVFHRTIFSPRDLDDFMERTKNLGMCLAHR